jgi:hypothetical protein
VNLQEVSHRSSGCSEVQVGFDLHQIPRLETSRGALLDLDVDLKLRLFIGVNLGFWPFLVPAFLVVFACLPPGFL